MAPVPNPLTQSKSLQRYTARKDEEFAYSKPTWEELRHRRCKVFSIIIYLLYFTVVGLLIWHFATTPASNLNWIPGYALFALTNFALLYPLGVTTIRTIVFPYSHSLTKAYIFGDSAYRYNDEFCQIVCKCYLLMHDRLLEKSQRDQEAFFGSPFLDKVRSAHARNIRNYTAFDINEKFKTIIELINLYAETNQKVISRNHNLRLGHVAKDRLGQSFIDITNAFARIQYTIQALQCTLVKHFDFPVAMTLADYYAENSLKFRYDVAPVILNT